MKALLKFVMNSVLTLALLTLSAMMAGGVLALTQSAPASATAPTPALAPQPFLEKAPA